MRGLRLHTLGDLDGISSELNKLLVLILPSFDVDTYKATSARSEALRVTKEARNTIDVSFLSIRWPLIAPSALCLARNGLSPLKPRMRNYTNRPNIREGNNENARCLEIHRQILVNLGR